MIRYSWLLEVLLGKLRPAHAIAAAAAAAVDLLLLWTCCCCCNSALTTCNTVVRYIRSAHYLLCDAANSEPSCERREHAAHHINICTTEHCAVERPLKDPARALAASPRSPPRDCCCETPGRSPRGSPS